MRLGVEPHIFLGRVVFWFLLVFLAFKPIAPAYTNFLGGLTGWVLHIVETSSDPNLHRVSEVRVDGGGIFYKNRLFPEWQPPAIPAEWVQANLVLLIPLMLATPAVTWGRKAKRMALALTIALALQVVDIVMTIKAFHAYDLEAYSYHYYSDFERSIYGFADAFAQSMDAQLFPFAIWAGIHFRQLIQPQAPQAVATKPNTTPRHERRRSGGKAPRPTSDKS